MIWIYIILAVAGALIVFIAVVSALGRRLPENHEVTLSLRLTRPPQDVWDVLADAPGHADWADGVTRVEPLESRNGRAAVRQHMGRNSFVLVTTASEPPSRLVREISDDHKMFSGTWTYEITPDGDGCTVRLTENGRIPGPIARFFMHKLMNPATFVRKHLRSLAQRFGEATEPA